MIKLAKLNDKPEIFHSIQGEGKNIGKPSIFVRLSLCNLYCIWCDTDYTWNWVGTKFKHNNDSLPNYSKFRKENYIIMLSTDDVVKSITQYNCNNIVITGGEPLVQKKELVKLLAKLKQVNPGYHIEFETNGTIIPGPELDKYADQYNVSVKLANSNVDYSDRIIDDTIRFFSKSVKSNFKFVVENDSDLDEILAIRDKFQIPGHRIYLMPQGTKVKTLKEKETWLIECCKKYNFNFTDRLHIHVYGDKRGV